MPTLADGEGRQTKNMVCQFNMKNHHIYLTEIPTICASVKRNMYSMFRLCHQQNQQSVGLLKKQRVAHDSSVLIGETSARQSYVAFKLSDYNNSKNTNVGKT